MPTFSVFTYGTLQIPAVMQAVTGKELKPVVATLTGHQRFKFKERTYPGIIQNEACSIEGMLYQGLNEETIEQLDQFEDVMYERCLLDVQAEDRMEKAFVYVTRDEYKDCLSDEEWNLGVFNRKYLKLYLKRIARF